MKLKVNSFRKVLANYYRMYPDVVGYLDILVFEELGFAVGPVVDGIDGEGKLTLTGKGTVIF